MVAAQVSRKHVLVLPDYVDLSSPDASRHRFLRLPHPRTRLPSLFLPATSGDGGARCCRLLEVQRISADTDKQRSWFIGQDVVSDGTLGLLTPFDPLWLVISILSTVPNRFMQQTELWEWAAQRVSIADSSSSSLDAEKELKMTAEDILSFGQLQCVQDRLDEVCDTQAHDGLILYRLDNAKVLRALKRKVDRLIDPENGIFGPLASTDLNKPISTAGGAECADGHTGLDRATAAARILNKDGIGDGQGLSEQLQLESRTKTVVKVLSNYLDPKHADELLKAYSQVSLPHWTMEQHLSTITTSSILSTTYLPGRGGGGGAEGGSLGGGSAALKKKAAVVKGSRGVEMLKKASTRNMNKLSTYFTKAPMAAAAKPQKTAAVPTRTSPRKRKADDAE
ncbi:hypothetical protein OIV83_001481 [Microbotryomycetes sp. JL201]|nr:hypothetical protein OIV83_001481 [Microbotryomycetes sp. JL201]